MTEDPRELKERAVGMLAELLPAYRNRLSSIDARLAEYYDGLMDVAIHNVYEILEGVKFLRVLRTYDYDKNMVKLVIRLYEGVWKNGRYVEDSGGLLFSGLKGYTHYRLQPFQVFALAGLFGPKKADGYRLVTELVLYLTRKSGKTLISAFILFFGFFFMDSNFEGYCCANSSDQAKLLYRTAQAFIRQMDPHERRIRFTASQTNWKPGQERSASITALSAGGKTKDGRFPQVCCADEFGSADFVNGKSDMLDLVRVIQSGMGPRTEPLTVITTTAGYAPNGPFRRQKETMENDLEKEVDLPADFCTPLPDDYRHAMLLQPDPWEQDDEELLLTDERIWRKANPMIGISVQPSFYVQEAHKARQNVDARKEFITKLCNVYQQGKVVDWIKPEKIRELQVDMTIEDCTADQGWVVFAGMDFSQGDDLHTIGYLAARQKRGGGTEFFADMDAWIKEDTLKKSSVASLYQPWIDAGYLHVSEGEVFQPSLPVVRIKDLLDKGVQFITFGYDAYQSKDPVNMLKAYLAGIGVSDPDRHVIAVSQTYASYNPAVDILTYCVKAEEPLIHFSANPLWPWCFGNVVLDQDTKMENRKPVKRNRGSDSCKVDPVQCLCTGFILETMFEGTAVGD